MSVEVCRTKWKCLLKGNQCLRLSLTIEGIYFIFLEQMDEKDILLRKTMLWNGSREQEASYEFEKIKNNL